MRSSPVNWLPKLVMTPAWTSESNGYRWERLMSSFDGNRWLALGITGGAPAAARIPRPVDNWDSAVARAASIPTLFAPTTWGNDGGATIHGFSR